MSEKPGISLSPETLTRFSLREFLLLALFIAGAAFTAGGAWVKLIYHEANGHTKYNKDIAEIRERLVRIEAKLK